MLPAPEKSTSMSLLPTSAAWPEIKENNNSKNHWASPFQSKGQTDTTTVAHPSSISIPLHQLSSVQCGICDTGYTVHKKAHYAINSRLRNVPNIALDLETVTKLVWLTVVLSPPFSLIFKCCSFLGFSPPDKMNDGDVLGFAPAGYLELLNI